MIASDDPEHLSAAEYVQRTMLPNWLIKRSKLIESAVSLIRPTAAKRDACRDDVARVTLQLVCEKAFLDGKNKIHTKEGKLAAGQLASALRRVEYALKAPELDSMLREIGGALLRTEKVQDFTETCECFSRRPSPKLSRKAAEGKRVAVHAAHKLLLMYADGETVNAAKKGSKFCKLAALLFDSPAADLQNQCRAFLRGLTA
jgi:hypothetical protein